MNDTVMIQVGLVTVDDRPYVRLHVGEATVDMPAAAALTVAMHLREAATLLDPSRPRVMVQ